MLHKQEQETLCFYEKSPVKMRLSQKNIQDLVQDFSASCTAIPTPSRAPLQVWDLFLGEIWQDGVSKNDQDLGQPFEEAT